MTLPEDIQRMYNEKFNNGAGLKEETIRHIHATLKQCLEKSVELNYIYKNPAKYCILPKDNTETKVNVIYAEDLKKIIDVLDKDNTYDVLLTLLTQEILLRAKEIIERITLVQQL